jgi:predicted metalloprotease with PDZ domain
MIRNALVLSLALMAITPALADPTEKEFEALKDQMRALQEELRDTAERLRKMDMDGGPSAQSFSYSFSTDRPMIGIVMVSAEDDRGVRLAGVTPGSPADKAGLESGDLIIAINGHDLTDKGAVDEAYDLLDDMQKGESFEFEYQRDGERRLASVEAEVMTPSLSFDFGRLPEFGYNFNLDDLDVEQFRDLAERGRQWQLQMKDWPGRVDIRPFVWQFGWAWSGLELAPINKQLGRYFGTDNGTLVLEAEGLEDSDLQGGDVILEIDGKPVGSPREVMRELKELEPGQSVAVTLVREGKRREVSVVAPQFSENSNFSFSWSEDE